MITTLASTGSPDAAGAVVGPPVAGVAGAPGVATAAVEPEDMLDAPPAVSSTISMLKPPNGFEVGAVLPLFWSVISIS